MRIRVVHAAGLLLAGLTGSKALAQAPRGADTLSPGAVADSVLVLHRLSDRVRSHLDDSLAWHHLGMVGWALMARAKTSVPPAGLDATRLGRLADSSLRIAADLAPGNVSYRLDVGRFLLWSGVPITRSAARGHFQRALAAGRSGADPSRHAEAALTLARTFWWRYDALANRRIVTGDAPRSVADAMRTVSARSAEALNQVALLQTAADALQQGGAHLASMYEINQLAGSALDSVLAGSGPDPTLNIGNPGSFKGARANVLFAAAKPLPPDLAGATDFGEAYALFREAYQADPSYPGAFRGLAMVYAERRMWTELASLAREHVSTYPRDSLAWLSLGLAAHRLERDVQAHAAFDTALALVGPAERARLDNWSRVLRPEGDTSRYANEADRVARANLYWKLSNPVWAESVDRTRIEFLSRVTYAELRWTVEEFGLQGAETDRGDIHVRYGPPATMIGIGPATNEAADITTFWLYDSGLIFAFRGMPTFGMSHIPNDDVSLMNAVRQLQPVRWDNTPAPAVDSLAVQVARFRSTPGFVDVVVAARLGSPDSIRKSMAVAGDVRAFFWLVVPGSTHLMRTDGRADSVGIGHEYHDDRHVDSAGVYSWKQHVESANLVYRVEEFGTTATRAGRAVGMLNARADSFPPLGFGLSDVLLATNASSPGAPATRWNGMSLAPIAGPIARGVELSVVWEAYEFAQEAGQARYEVTLTLQRERSSAARIAAAVVGAMENTLRVQRANDRVVIGFDRSVPYAAAFADHVSLALGNTPAGTYSLKLTVVDHISGKTAFRTTTFVIAE